MSPSDRYNKIKQCKLCINCLAAEHKVQECTSSYTCRKCKQKHHSLLHRDNSNTNTTHCKSEKENELESNNNETECKNVQTHF